MTTFYIVHQGRSEPWWYRTGAGGMKAFSRCPDGLYPARSCGYVSVERAHKAIPAILEDVGRFSTSTPILEVLSRAELYARLGKSDPLLPGPVSPSSAHALSFAIAPVLF